jgi:hypothetical protein
MLSNKDGLPDDYDETIEDGYQLKLKEININIIDSSGNFYSNYKGEEQYINKTLLNNINKINGIMLVYDITNKESFKKLEYFQKILQKYSENNLNKFGIVIIGNKFDLKSRLISKWSADSFAENFLKPKRNIPVFEITANSNENVNQIFLSLLIETIKYNITSNSINTTNISNEINNVEIKKRKFSIVGNRGLNIFNNNLNNNSAIISNKLNSNDEKKKDESKKNDEKKKDESKKKKVPKKIELTDEEKEKLKLKKSSLLENINNMKNKMNNYVNNMIHNQSFEVVNKPNN